MRVIFNVTSALLVSVAVGILMVNVSSLSWMREPPSPQPALGGSLSKYDHGVDKVNSAKARIVVERRTRLTRYVLPSQLVSAVDEERLDASGQGFGDSIRHKGLPQHRRVPCDEGCGHASTRIKHPIRVCGSSRMSYLRVRCVTLLRESRCLAPPRRA